MAAVEPFKFLGTTISQDLKWDTNFLHQLRKFNLPQELILQFYSAVIESAWFATQQDTHRLQRTISSAERIIGLNLPSLQDVFTIRARKQAGKVITNPLHPGHILELLPSISIYLALHTRTSRYRNSFFPHTNTLMNKEPAMRAVTAGPQGHAVNPR